MDLKYYKRYYCSGIENVENFEKAKADNFIGWECHHRLETHTSDGKRRLVDISHNELKALGMYYNRPADELIFLTISEHRSLHTKGESNPMYGKQGYWKGKTGPNKGKLAGENNPMYGKHHTLLSIQKMSEAKKGKHHSAESKKKMSDAHKGKKCSEETKKKIGEAHKGRKFSKEATKRMSEAMKGKNIWTRGRHWYNNGKENKYCYECPEGFVPGMLR